MNIWTKEWIYEWNNEYMKERMNIWMKEWMNEIMHEWINDSFIHGNIIMVSYDFSVPISRRFTMSRHLTTTISMYYLYISYIMFYVCTFIIINIIIMIPAYIHPTAAHRMWIISDWEGLGHSSLAGPVRSRNFTNSIVFLRRFVQVFSRFFLEARGRFQM